MDRVILGGGSHFHDEFKGLRHGRHYWYLIRYLVVFLFARLLGRDVWMLGMGIGPLHRRTTRWLLTCVVRLSHWITVRDSASYQELQAINCRRKPVLSFDLAALLFDKEPPSLSRGNGNLLGISIVSLSGNQGVAFWETFFSSMEAIFREQESLVVHIFVFRGGDRECDVPLSEELCRRLSAHDPNRVLLVDYGSDFSDLSRHIYNCRAFISTRFHASLLAYLCGCRLLFIPYQRKVMDLASEIGLSHRNILSFSDEISGAKITEVIRKLVLERAWPRPTRTVVEAVSRAKVTQALISEKWKK